MISVNQALSILQKNLPACSSGEEVLVSSALGRILAEDYFSEDDSPRCTNSAMDGYAVRWNDIKNASLDKPITLQVVGESQAGIPYCEKLLEGQVIRISTGAMMPEGTDTVVRVEDTKEGGAADVKIFAIKKKGQDIRFAGEEFKVGDKLLQKGVKLRARQLALLVAVGCEKIEVFRQPQIGLLITGSELTVVEDSTIKQFQIRDSNSIMLNNAVLEDGGVVSQCHHVDDNLQKTIEIVEKLMVSDVDVILCSGGVSVGRHDHVKTAVESLGFEQLFWRIKQKPGKPLFAAIKGAKLLFGLPGNPVSAFMCYSHYVKPLISAMQGRDFQWKFLTAAADELIENSGKRTTFMRVKIDYHCSDFPLISKVEKQGSHMLSSVVDADGYIILEPGEKVLKGGSFKVYLL